MRYFIECAYRGTNYSGWQIQINALSVQEVIEKALTTLLKHKIEITGSSRTDAGVHAKQQFAHFETDKEIVDCDDLIYRMNKLLPLDISVQKIFKVADDYHSRFEAVSRKYEYRISRKKNPFQREFSYEFNGNLDLDLMNEACLLLFQYTDFQCFSKIKTDVTTFNSTILEVGWEQNSEDLLIFSIKANRFLRGMVRAIVGTLLEVGLSKISVREFEEIILSKDRKKAGWSVPAKGLILMEVNY